MLFHNMSSSETTGNPSVAHTQYFTEDVYFRASDGLVTRAVAGYHYSANWEIYTGGTLTR